MTGVILASGSPSRLALLRQTGITAHVIVPGIDEPSAVAEHRPDSVRDETALLARLKGEEVIRRILAGEEELPDATDFIVIASDSLLDLDGDPIGKPGTPERVRKVWEKLGGTTSTLHTGHFTALLRRRPDGTVHEADRRIEVGATQVTTAAPTPEEMSDYIATGEPLHVAGALTIDGYGSAFVTGLSGDHTNVIGLSMPLLRTMVRSMGVHWPSLWD